MEWCGCDIDRYAVLLTQGIDAFCEVCYGGGDWVEDCYYRFNEGIFDWISIELFDVNGEDYHMR